MLEVKAKWSVHFAFSLLLGFMFVIFIDIYDDCNNKYIPVENIIYLIKYVEYGKIFLEVNRNTTHKKEKE